MDEEQRFVIPLSLIGRPENVSDETVRRLARRLAEKGKIVLQTTPTGRGLVNIAGYLRLRQEILSVRTKAA